MNSQFFQEIRSNNKPEPLDNIITPNKRSSQNLEENSGILNSMQSSGNENNRVKNNCAPAFFRQKSLDIDYLACSKGRIINNEHNKDNKQIINEGCSEVNEYCNDDYNDIIIKRKKDENLLKKTNNTFINSKEISVNDTKDSTWNNKAKNKNLIKNLNSDIKIKNLKRPFTIFLHDIELKNDYNCCGEKTKDFLYKLNIKTQIYCGSQEYTKPRIFEWKSPYFHKNRRIGKTIEFDLGYDILPMFASIIIKIKVILLDKQKQPVKIENLFWTNFKLFDHNRRLKTGK